MKQYVIDELRPGEYEKIKAYLDGHLEAGAMDGIYWMPLDESLLSATQADHFDCHPFYVALELTADQLAAEFLIRTQQRIRCDCMANANEAQRNWIIRSVDNIFNKLQINS